MRHAPGVVLLLGLIAASSALAQQYPNRPVRLIIPMSAGGATDILIRTITPKMAELFGQPIVVDNRPAANGVLGDEMAVRAPPDGYTLHANSIAISINPSLYKLSYDILRDLAPVTELASIDLLLGVYPQLPVKSVRDLIALARAQPNKLNYASFGVGSIAHIAGEMLKQATQTQIVHVPYKSSPLAVQETVAGQTQLVFGGVSYMLPQARAGRLTAVGVASLKRTPLAPEIPTLDESGVPGFDVTAWFGMWMPAKTPKPIVTRVYEVVAKSHPPAAPRKRLRSFRPWGKRAPWAHAVGAIRLTSLITSTTTGLFERERLLQSAFDLARLLDADAAAAHRLGDLGEIEFAEAPQLVGMAAQVAAVVPLERRKLLTQRAVVVDQHHEVDAVAQRRVQLGQVIVHAAVAGEAQHRPIGQRALHAHRAGQAPPERARAADVALARLLEIDHLARPHARVAGVGNHHAVRRQRVGDFLADALRAGSAPHRN